MVDIILIILAAVGHLVLWVALVNRVHGLGIKRRLVHWLTLACMVMLAILPVAVLGAIVNVVRPQPSLLATMLYGAACTYIAACAVVCIVGALQRLYWRFHTERKGALASNHTTRVNLTEQSDEALMSPGIVSLLGRLPGNQVLKVHVQEKHLRIPRLAPQHQGLRIAHLTDLHMSGRMTRPFYEYVVDETNRCGADIIAITGDIVDSDACLPWIPEVLGRLQAPGGVFYVLGNHDLRVNQLKLKSALDESNLIYVGENAQRLNIREIDLILGGNERPWTGKPTDFTLYPQHDETGLPLRIVLSHSPDQLAWAVDNGVDLILAGHVHGGQVCLPFVGPLTAPSLHGVRYAAGTFRVGDTVMHVSRGTASLTPLRWNCPPEIAVLNLCPRP